MIKAIFTALTGIDADKYDSDDSQTEWERRRYLDENDLDDDSDDSDDSESSESSERKGWLGLW